MHSAFYMLVIVGVFGCLILEVTGNDTEESLADILLRGETLNNETTIELLNGTAIGNETYPVSTVRSMLDLVHPVVAIKAFYEQSRQQIQQWMEKPNSYLMMMSALMGMLTAFVAVLLFCFIYSLCIRCYSQGRKHRISSLANRLDDGNKLIVPKGDSDIV
ncbi:hypothetical protein Tcan_15320 [Toxocara canis]|uniref:Uncharacterized protein n=2 Tax=Toxocara canis TaxID=6265 RepID=A0A0B2VII1_TOXCA|nr:hypothetical protein Tcan_15320 [Toxocara canis]VDM37683.1 unnamed protein product [Toxocara canis]